MSGKRENDASDSGLAKKAKADEPGPGADPAPEAGADPATGEGADPALAPAPLEHLADKLRKWLRCEKCKATIARRFKVCHRGHLACGKCVKSRRTKCPECKVKYVTDSPVVVRKIHEAIIEFDTKKDK